MLALYVTVTSILRCWAQDALDRLGRRLRRLRAEPGQTTAEYALVLLGAAAVALLVVGWAAKTNKVSKLLDSVFDTLLGRVR